MRWRVAVLTTMGVVLGAGALVCIVQSSELNTVGQRILAGAGQNGLSAAQGNAAGRAFVASNALGALSTPLAVGSLLAVLGVLMVFAIRWHRRESATGPRP